MSDSTQRLSVFPLAGAILFPHSHLPLHIFEPRYRAMISDALARNRLIGMVQPRNGGEHPALFDVGCIGKITEVNALPDGRFDILLEGIARFRIAEELPVTTMFRQVRADTACFAADEEDDTVLSAPVRGELEYEARAFAGQRGFEVDWNIIARMDDAHFVNVSSQAIPLDIGSKQALLEAPTVSDRADLLIQFLQFLRLQGEGGATLQ